MSASVGVIGVGELGRAIVEGLCGIEEPPQIWLSPRGRAIAAQLASHYPGVVVCDDNREVAVRADVVVLAVRPDSLREALADVDVRPGMVVISAIAGASHALLGELLGDDCTIVRAVPMPAVQTRNSVTVVFPANDTATALFDQLGGSIVARDEDEFAALMASTATISTFMEYVGSIVGWLASQGIESTQADRYVRGFFHAASSELADESRSLRDLTQDHETVGGLNEQLRRTWFEPAAADLHRGLDALAERAR